MSSELAIFDLDGTLVDSLGDLADSMNAVLESLVLPTHPRESYRRFVGDGIVKLVRRALPTERLDEEFVGECAELMRQEYALRQHIIYHPLELLEILDCVRRTL
jgi:phosphoglycolate phosphatase